jgi:hypothetical protein
MLGCTQHPTRKYPRQIDGQVLADSFDVLRRRVREQNSDPLLHFAEISVIIEQYDNKLGVEVETLVAVDTATTVADAFDPAVLEATADATADAAGPAIQPVDVIIVTSDGAIEGNGFERPTSRAPGFPGILEVIL